MKITADRKVMLAVSSCLIVFTILGAMMGRVVAVEGTYAYLRLFNQVLDCIVNNYVQPVQIDSLMEGAYRGMLEALDPANEYLSPAEYQKAASGTDAGPAEVGLVLSKRRGYAVVVSARLHSPAAEAGVTTGDLVMSIDGRTTRKMGVWEATQALRGKLGSKTTIVVNSADGSDKKTLSLVRRTLGPQPPTGASVPPGVGVVRIAAIREGDARRLDQSIGSLKSQGVNRLLLDLRGCVSDSLPEVVGMASLFMSEGTVVTVTDRYDGDKAYRTDGRRPAWDRQLAVLVDAGTARTCEALAAALRDGLGAPILGQRTWGLGTLQRLIPLANGDGVLLAVGKLLSPAGKEWNGRGIEPDLQIPGSEGDPGDPQRQKAIDYVRGLSVPTRRTAA